MMMWMWTSLLSSLAFAQPLLNEVGEDGVPEMLRAGPEFPEITADAAFDPFAPLQVVGGTVTEIQFEGQDYIDEFVLRSAMRLSEGDEMDPAKIRQSIEANSCDRVLCRYPSRRVSTVHVGTAEWCSCLGDGQRKACHSIC